jgi:hypothetical protein
VALSPNPDMDLGAAAAEAGPGGAESSPGSSPLDVLSEVLKGASAAAAAASSAPKKKAPASKGDSTMLWVGLVAILLLSKRR